MPRLSPFVLWCAIAGVLATLAGVAFQLVHGGTTMSRAVAYALWMVAALVFVVMIAVGNGRVAQALNLPFVEGWRFVAAAAAFTALGSLVDVLGS